jgi:hypothetical protein
LSIIGRHITIRGRNTIGTPPTTTPFIPDSDATAFLTAAGITDPTISSAIDTLVKDLKSYNLWNKMQAIYPFVGGTATTHKWNLKDLRDLNAAYRLVFNGGWTHSSNGVKGNGVNGYADTFYIQNTHLPSQNDLHMSLYSRSNVSEIVNDMGLRDRATGPTTRTFIQFARNFTDTFWTTTNDTINNFVDTSSLGQIIISRTASNFSAAYRNGLLAQSTTAASVRRAQYKMYISNTSLENGLQSGVYSSKEWAFCTMGLGLSGTDASNLYTAVQTFQTTLGRQV